MMPSALPQHAGADTGPEETESPAESQGVMLHVLHAALEPLAEPCLIIDGQSRILAANACAKNLLQRRGRLLGRRLETMLADNQITRLAADAGRTEQTITSPVTLILPSEGWRNGRRYVAVLTPLSSTPQYIRLLLRPESAPAPAPPPPESLLQRMVNPLSILQGYIETLLDGVINDPVLMRQSLMTMRRQTEQIERMLHAPAD